MIKKLVFLVGGTVAVLALVNSVWSGSVRTAWKRAQAKLERQISPEFELARIRDEIAQLTPDMHKNIARIAEEMVQVESLDRRIGDLTVKLDRSKDELAAMTSAIESGAKKVSLGGRELSPAQVKDKLRTCRNVERELANTQKILDAKKAGVDAARQQLVEMRQQKDQLEVMAAEFEAQWKTLQLEQTRSKLKLDDSRLAEIKGSFEKLRERIDVERRKAELAGQFASESFLVPEKKIESTQSVIDEVKEYFGTKTEKTDAAKK
jgi:chromosome segregation ATPase